MFQFLLRQCEIHRPVRPRKRKLRRTGQREARQARTGRRKGRREGGKETEREGGSDSPWNKVMLLEARRMTCFPAPPSSPPPQGRGEQRLRRLDRLAPPLPITILSLSPSPPPSVPSLPPPSLPPSWASLSHNTAAQGKGGTDAAATCGSFHGERKEEDRAAGHAQLWGEKGGREGGSERGSLCEEREGVSKQRRSPVRPSLQAPRKRDKR
jgi:hypothetical protein